MTSAVARTRPARREPNARTPTIAPALLSIDAPATRRHYVASPPAAWKRALDYSLALLLFVAALPIMVLTAIAVRLTSAGPAIYRQTRVGLGGRIVTIAKFRSMYHECERISGIQWCTKNDPRITPLGHWLRKLHLDELPQLWNVLRGEMSLVGPRPERPEIVADLEVMLPGYGLRHTVMPGITGFAQIHLPPDSSLQTVKNKMIYDRYYVENAGLWLDLKCLVCTALKVVGLGRVYRRAPRKPAGE